MRIRYMDTSSLFLSMITLLFSVDCSSASRADRWGLEAIGSMAAMDNGEPSQSELEMNTYKQNLLQYVLQTGEPKEVNSGESMPFVMDKIYNLLADKTTGRQKRSAPFNVDLIRGLEDHYRAQRRMQFWFNTSSINASEDIIECYFHVYKRRPLERQHVPRADRQSHSVTVSLYRVYDEHNVMDERGNIGAGVQLLERQFVSAYTSQWIVFKTNLKETVRHWIRHPNRNKGLLLTATDPFNNHVNGSHIDFVQRGESPESQQPIFVIYTDQEKKKSKKHKKKHRNNINYLIENFLNEDSRVNQQNQNQCAELLERDVEATDRCSELLLRHRRSLVDPSIDIDEEIDGLEREKRDIDSSAAESEPAEDEPQARRRLRIRHRKDLYISANRRKSDEQFCQVKPLYISFQALGWGKWIVAPDGFNANYCDGSCPFPLTSALTASNHAVLQSVSNYYHPKKIKPPCCVPQKLERMSILYYQDESTVTMRNYDNMIVETCGCR